MTRKSLALYYYSNGRPDEEVSDEHSTLVRPRPGEIIDGLNGHTTPRAILKRFIPPIVSDIRSYFRKK
jgi:hypothetical protein